jgi:hypothetical protein
VKEKNLHGGKKKNFFYVRKSFNKVAVELGTWPLGGALSAQRALLTSLPRACLSEATKKKKILS